MIARFKSRIEFQSYPSVSQFLGLFCSHIDGIGLQ